MAYISKVSLIDKILLASPVMTRKELKSKTVDELKAILNITEANESLNNLEIQEDMTETQVLEGGSPETTETIEESPLITSPEWTDYVLKMFDSAELIDGRPICDGLRRVFELLIGEIFDSTIDVVAPPSDQNSDATVICTIRYRCHRSLSMKTISDAFNVNKVNTVLPWSTVPVATAATKAEARALRKGLRLRKILSSEEKEQGFADGETVSLSTESDFTKSPGTDQQRIGIKNMCVQLNIDRQRFLEHEDVESLDTFSYEEASRLLKKLNDYQRGTDNGGLDVPKELINNDLEL